jgi:Arc/MetJ-type ribon-helix-helix transcriptional regulator
MAHALAKENENFIRRMVRSGRFNNQSEVVREALRRMEAEGLSYLTPPPLTNEQVERIYGPNPKEEARARAFGRAAFNSVRRAAGKGRHP